jgi:hypothetical protein
MYGVQDMEIWQCLVILWAMFIIFRLITYYILRVSTKLRS